MNAALSQRLPARSGPKYRGCSNTHGLERETAYPKLEYKQAAGHHLQFAQLALLCLKLNQNGRRKQKNAECSRILGWASRRRLLFVLHLALHLDELCSSVESFFFGVESVDLFLQMLVLKLCLLVQLRMFCVLLSKGPLFSLELARLEVHFLI